jgi:hypothetical protein
MNRGERRALVRKIKGGKPAVQEASITGEIGAMASKSIFGAASALAKADEELRQSEGK